MFPESSTPTLAKPTSPDTALRHSSHPHPSHRPIPGPDTPRTSTPHPLRFCQRPAMPGQKLVLFSPPLYAGIPRAPAKPFGWCAHVFGGRRTEAHHTPPHRLCHSLYHAPDIFLISFAIFFSRA